MPEHYKTKLIKEGHEKAKIWDTPDQVPAVAAASSIILLSDSLLTASTTQNLVEKFGVPHLFQILPL